MADDRSLTDIPISDTNTTGAFARETTGQYDVNQYQYPEDLLGVGENGVNQYGMNYVMFYINAQDDSKLVKDSRTETIPNVTSRVGRDLNGRGYNNAQVIGGSSIGSAVIGKLFGGNTGGTAGLVTGAVASGYLSDISAEEVGSIVSNLDGQGLSQAAQREFSKPLRRLKTAIALHTPNNWAIRYGVNYEDTDTALAQGIMAGGAALASGAANTVAALADGDVGGAGSALSQAGGQLNPMVAAAGLTLNPLMGGAMSAMSGVAANPKKEVVFKGVDFRTFTLDYQFYPRSKTESDNVKRILDEFKYHMHPEFKDPSGFLFTYPSEFDIYYYAGGDENKYVHRHTSCVLTAMNVNYSPQGQFTSFANGAPTQINLTLEFKELAIMTREALAATGEVIKNPGVDYGLL